MSVQVNITLPIETIRKLEAIAFERSISLSALIIKIVEQQFTPMKDLV